MKHFYAYNEALEMVLASPTKKIRSAYIERANAKGENVYPIASAVARDMMITYLVQEWDMNLSELTRMNQEALNDTYRQRIGFEIWR